jgi:hypothetical protein
MLTFCFFNVVAQNSQLAGVYVCSSEDMIRLNYDGTGRMIMSYHFDGVRSFGWEYDAENQSISIRSEPPSELRNEMLPIYLTLYLRKVNGRLVLEHNTGGPTFAYIKK